MVERRRIGSSNPAQPRQFAYKAKPGQQAVNSLKPLKLKLCGEHPFHLDELLVFTDDYDVTVLFLVVGDNLREIADLQLLVELLHDDGTQPVEQLTGVETEFTVAADLGADLIEMVEDNAHLRVIAARLGPVGGSTHYRVPCIIVCVTHKFVAGAFLWSAKVSMNKSMSEAASLFAQGLALHQAGRLADAEEIYREILSTQPDHFDSLHLLGVIFFQSGNHEAAVQQIAAALKKNPDNVFALCNRGIALRKLKRFEEALASLDRAVTLRPDFADALVTRGNVLRDFNRLEEALASYDRAIALRSDKTVALSNRGFILYELKRFDEALASLDRAVTLRPDFAEALVTRGIVLRDFNRREEALASFDRAIALRSDKTVALSNRGFILYELKRFDEALVSYDHALALRPDNVETHLNRAYCLLLIGDFDRGWKEFEWRWKSETGIRHQRNFARPLWLGSDEIAGKTILIHAEEGLGDAIQFCRYVPLFVERGGRVIVQVQAALLELMTTLAGAAQIVARGDPLPDYDLHCPVHSLPLAFGTRLGTIPYLRAPSHAVARWNARLPKGRPRIGLAWSGSPTNWNDRNRPMRLSSLLPLLSFDATFVSLQNVVRREDEPVPERRRRAGFLRQGRRRRRRRK
jgi:tetratricopeptide (TPR) repeat protein